ncbi:hypothetical protein MBLNU459_g8052t1 [Dothideomycetes sp. NU459]
MASTASAPVVDIVIRFTTSIPDLLLEDQDPSRVTPLALKQRIRSLLTTAEAASRFRLICSGRLLPDTAALSSCINIPRPPPRLPAADTDKHKDKSSKAQGKAPIRPPSPPPRPRIYINCSVGDILSPEDLAQEAKDAAAAYVNLAWQTTANTSSDGSSSQQKNSGAATPVITTTTTTTTSSAPRGFDRLLTSGFTPADVAQLRTQFLAIQAHTHTPETMPTGDALRALEDRWLDNDNNMGGGGGSGSGSGGAGDGGGDEADAGGLEDMLWGNIIGFFWPVAVFIFWREANLWTQRRKIAVLTGVVVNITAGFLRLAG